MKRENNQLEVFIRRLKEEGFARLAAGSHEVRFGGPCRGRTYGPLIKSQLLYQLS